MLTSTPSLGDGGQSWGLFLPGMCTFTPQDSPAMGFVIAFTDGQMGPK